MKYIKALLLTACLSLPLWAQDQQVQHPAGFQTRLPAAFKVTQDASGMAAVAPNQAYLVILKHHSYANFEAFARDANLEKDGFTLVGDVRSLNSSDRSFRAAKQTPDGYLVADTFVSFSPYGGGSLIVALSDQNHAEAAYNSAYQMAHNLTFSQPQLDQIWSSALTGKHLVYLYTGNGYSERKDLYLASNGQFAQRNDASSASINGSGYLAGGSDGRWQILSGGQLVLQFNNGQTGSYILAPGQAGNEVLLNGKRFFVLNS
ncbi:hypothetical protein JST97_18350 [bacterium]|nr:hypothetical protein [bacterium]